MGLSQPAWCREPCRWHMLRRNTQGKCWAVSPAPVAAPDTGSRHMKQGPAEGMETRWAPHILNDVRRQVGEDAHEDPVALARRVRPGKHQHERLHLRQVHANSLGCMVTKVIALACAHSNARQICHERVAPAGLGANPTT